MQSLFYTFYLYDLEILERFVVIMYDRTCMAVHVNEARLELFSKKGKSYSDIPPTKEALLLHVRRSTFQGGFIWGQSTVCQPFIPSPVERGWTKKYGVWQVKWITLSPIADSCKELKKCACKTECKGRCTCFKSALKCTGLCECACLDN